MPGFGTIYRNKGEVNVLAAASVEGSSHQILGIPCAVPIDANNRVRQELLNPTWFRSLDDARRQAAEWRHDYNANHPHSSLDNPTAVATTSQTVVEMTNHEMRLRSCA